MKRLNEAIFGYGSPVTLAVFRIAVGALNLLNMILMTPDFYNWFSEKGYVPLEMAKVWSGSELRINLLGGSTSASLNLAFFILVMLASLTTMLGVWTRVSTIVLAVGMISLHTRNAFVLNGGDTLLRNALIVLAVSPCGAAVSWDRWRAVKRGAGPISDVSLWPQRLLQYQWALMYFTTVWVKGMGEKWRNGTASWYPTQLTEFDKLPFPAFFDTQPFVMMTTYGTLIVELALATLIFSKAWRKYVIIGGIMLHGIIEWRFNIPLFAFLSMSGYLLFYGGEEYAAWWEKLRAKWPKLDGLSRRLEVKHEAS